MSRIGFTLIETVLVILILSIALPPFAMTVATVMQKNIYSQTQATAVMLAEAELERVANLRFSAVASESTAAFSSPFDKYTHQIVCGYVNPGALDTIVVGPTDYKRVQIIVNSNISGNITLTTIITNN